MNHINVRTGLGKFWKIMEMDDTVLQDLENFGKEGFSKCPWKSFAFLLGEILRYPKMDITCVMLY